MINSIKPTGRAGIVRATAPPGDASADLHTDRNVRERERVSQWPMCQRDEC